MSRYLSILEVSQKQAYIFSSNKVKNNIVNSAVINRVLSPDYLSVIWKDSNYSDAENLVYAGGGHTVLEFGDCDTAKRMISILTESIYRDFDELEVFAKTIQYDESRSPEENLKELTKSLEQKKSKRLTAFKQGSYGIEAIDSETLDVKKENCDSAGKADVEKFEYNEEAKNFTPDGFEPVYKFGDLGGSKNDSNFVAVVHIDGNGMGKRVEELYQTIGSNDWNETKKKLRAFSEGIDADFKAAYREMADVVAENITKGSLKDELSLKGNNFPVRRIITAGDDICFVSEGRIGVECARIFIEKLNDKKNIVDGKGYSCCAGVAIVHQKYPFYKAYELAEMLCSNAKKYGAKLSPNDNGRNISSIDWHIDFGEIKDSLEEIRSAYNTADGCRLEARPYIVNAPADIINRHENVSKMYSNFRRVICSIQSNEEAYGIGKVKELRGALKKGETATKNYITFNKMRDILINHSSGGTVTEVDLLKLFTGQNQEVEAFVMCDDGKKHSFLFDAIELMDTYIALEGGNQ